MINFTDGNYTGSDPLLIETFTQLSALGPLCVQVKAVLHCGKTVKGTLNEPTYQQRLEENELTGNHDEIVREQYSRRREYFRMRMLLQFHLIERLQQTFDSVLQRSGKVRQLVDHSCEFGLNKEDYLYTLGATLTALEETNVVELLSKARNFVEEKDETDGHGEKAFERFWRQIPGWYGKSSLPAQYQPVFGHEQNPLDLGLCQLMNEAWSTAIAYEQLINQATGVHPYAHRRPLEAKPSRAELRRYLEYHHRLCQMAETGVDEWTRPIFLGTSQTAKVTTLLEPLLAAIATIVPTASRWLAMSNYMAAVALTAHLGELDGAAQSVIFDSGALNFHLATLQSFDSAMRAAADSVKGKSFPFPTNAYFVVREGFNPKSVSKRHLMPDRTVFQAGDSYQIGKGGEREFFVRGWFVTVEEGEKFGQLALTKEDADRIAASFLK